MRMSHKWRRDISEVKDTTYLIIKKERPPYLHDLGYLRVGLRGEDVRTVKMEGERERLHCKRKQLRESRCEKTKNIKISKLIAW